MYTVVIVGNGSNHPPVADPNGPYTGTEGVPIAYDGNGSYDTDGTIVSYLWTFGDGNNATGVTPTHIYAQDGTYNVTLTVTDNDGATDTSITTATIADTEPIADFSATPTSGQESLTVTFSDNSTSYDGIEAWDWDFDNDGVTDSNVQNPTHVYAEEGVYTVSLKANESDGDSETMTKTDYIGVTKVNKAPFTPANPSPSDGATDVPIDAVLSWTGGDPDAEDTVTYDVYFGTNTSPPQVAGNQLETTYDPGTRDYSTGYYWRIVATDEHDASNESEVWSFTTTAVPAPETIPPLVSNPSANPDVIPDDTDNDPRWGETSQINVTVTDDSGVLRVTINLSAIGGSPIQSMTSIPDTNTWTVSTNASAGTAPGNNHLKINATDTNGNSNTSVSVELRVMKNGDIDGDGTVTLDDSEYLANYLTKIPGYGEIEEVVADVDEQVDECVTIADYEYLKNHISGELGYEKLH
jgi:PKD repeat protein